MTQINEKKTSMQIVDIHSGAFGWVNRTFEKNCYSSAILKDIDTELSGYLPLGLSS